MQRWRKINHANTNQQESLSSYVNFSQRSFQTWIQTFYNDKAVNPSRRYNSPKLVHT